MIVLSQACEHKPDTETVFVAITKIRNVSIQ